MGKGLQHRQRRSFFFHFLFNARRAILSVITAIDTRVTLVPKALGGRELNTEKERMKERKKCKKSLSLSLFLLTPSPLPFSPSRSGTGGGAHCRASPERRVCAGAQRARPSLCHGCGSAEARRNGQMALEAQTKTTTVSSRPTRCALLCFNVVLVYSRRLYS